MARILGIAGGPSRVHRSGPALGTRSPANRELQLSGAPVVGLIVLIATTTLPSCRSGSGRDPDPEPAAKIGGLTAEQRIRADRLINPSSAPGRPGLRPKLRVP
jgi:hypothetical protein